MSKGLNVKSPLIIDSVDGPYALIKDAKEAVKQNLKMIILTSPGERIWIPSFGVGIRSYLFEQLTEATTYLIKQAIQDQVRAYAPYISRLSVTVEKASDLVSNTNYKENNANTIIVGVEYDVETSSVFFQDFFNLEVTP
jgi:phage baseplate assembly protein W